jgi:signal transduction histidine kinase
MKKPQKPLIDNEILRQKASALLLKKELLNPDLGLSEFDNLKLIHELQVHKIELELQNEALALANAEAAVATQKYMELYDFAPSGYFTLSNEGKIIELNLHAASMLGKERQRLINIPFGLFVSDDTKLIFNNFLSKVFEGKKDESCEVTISIVDNKQPLYVFLTGHVSENSKECYITMTDISTCKKAELALQESEKRLLQLNRDKDLFISILSHDLRSPFSNLLGLSEVLMEEIRELNIDEIENHIISINTTAKTAFILLEDLLKWTRAQHGMIPFKPQNLSFADIFKNIFEDLNPNAKAKNITIYYSPKDKINVYADIDMLKTILRNLITNAIKFTNSGGEINISAEQIGSNVSISVSDNGIGIAPDALIKLFDISKVITTKGTADETGTGLGLLLCKEFVEKHCGKIWVESEVGKGSDFKFTIPMSVE